MSTNVPIKNNNQLDLTAPTPQNTPLTHAPIAAGLSRPTVPDISEDPAESMDDGDGDGDDGGDETGDGTGIPAGVLQSGAMRSVLERIVQTRLKDLVGTSSGYIESLPVEVKRTVAALHGVQVKQNELQNRFKREFWELERKYLDLQKPLYERRTALISGSSKPSAEEIAAGEAQSAKDDDEYTPLPPSDPPASAPIPEFWLTALRNHVGISELITERDEEALKHLRDIQLSYLADDAGEGEDAKPGFKLAFVFGPNEFFENAVLEKTYVYQKEIDYSGDFMYDRAEGTAIKWKEEKDLTKVFEVKKQRNKNTNRTRLVRKSHPTDSFFNFFSPPVPPSEEAIENGDVDEDELEELESRLELDYQIGEDIKERIIPRAIDYFTGKALEFDADVDDDEFDDDDDDEEGDEDLFDEEDDTDSEPEPPARRRGPPKRGAGAAGADKNVKAEECKQQ